MVFLLTIIALSTFECLYAKVGFMKDQSMDAIFPPRIIRSETGIPDGHLRPLGWQKKPESKVTEESNVNLSPTEFYIQYVSSSTPVVFRAAVKDVPAMTLWDEEDKFLNKNCMRLKQQVKGMFEPLLHDACVQDGIRGSGTYNILSDSPHT